MSYHQYQEVQRVMEFKVSSIIGGVDILIHEKHPDSSVSQNHSHTVKAMWVVSALHARNT